MQIIRFVEKHFWIVLVTAVVAGLALPGIGDMSVIVPYLRYLVMAMLFMVFLKVDVVDILHQLRDVKLIGYVSVSFLFVMPVIVYLVLKPFGENLALGALVLTAIPPGTAAPTLTDLIKGNTALAAGVTIVTSLLAPFSMPLVLGVVIGETVGLDRSELFISLAITMFVPLIASQFIRRFAKPVAAYLKPRSSTVNIFILFFLIYPIIASQREFVLEEPLTTFVQGIIIFGLLAVLHVIGYFMAPWLGKKDRLALATTRAYMNLGLAIVVAANFFGPKVLLVVTLAELPWGLLPGPFKALAQKLK